MTPATRILGAIVAILIATGCAETKVQHYWKDELYSGPKIRKALVLGLMLEPAYRKLLEDGMVRAVERANVETFAGYQLFPGDERIDEYAAEEEIRARGIEAVVVTRLIDTRTDKVYMPEVKEIRAYPAPYLGRGWYGYYASSYRVMHTEGYETKFAISTIETEVYSVATDEVIWSGLTRTVETSVEAAIASYVLAVGGPLRTSDLF